MSVVIKIKIFTILKVDVANVTMKRIAEIVISLIVLMPYLYKED